MNISRKKLKGFTLIELLAILVLLGILFFIAIPLINHIVKEAKSKVCDLDAKAMVVAADNYVIHDSLIIKTGETRLITLEELESAGYISDMYSPYAKKDACTGYVVVSNEGQDGNDYYTYQSELKCGTSCVTSNYDLSHEGTGTGNTDTNDIKDQMKEKNNDWYYEGANPNNWVKFGRMDDSDKRGIMWRMIKIDATGIKMAYEGIENGSMVPLEDGRALINGSMGVPWDNMGTNKWNKPSSLVGKLDNWLSRLYIPNLSNYVSSTNWKVGGVPYQNPTNLRTFLTYQDMDSTNLGGNFSGLTNYKSTIGMINAVDFLYTSDNVLCMNSYRETGSNNECAYNSDGALNNFLQKDRYYYWTINARSDSTNKAWNVTNSGLIGSALTNLGAVSVRPVLNLKLDTKFVSGSGTVEDPYILEDYMLNIWDIPSITLLGADPVYVRQFDEYVDEGAKASDEIDGDISSNITVSSNVNTNIPGEYQIQYNVKDSDNNEAIQVIRKVIVVERDTPIIKLNGSSPTYVTIYGEYLEQGATAYDINYGDISKDIIVTGTVDANTLGAYYITYNVTNEDGIKAYEVERKVIVRVPVPQITINGANPMLVDIGTSYTEEGATAFDEVDGDLTSSIIKKIERYDKVSNKWEIVNSIDSSKISSYLIKYSITNSFGVNSFQYRTVKVVEAEGPDIIFNPNGNALSQKAQQTTIGVSKTKYDIDTNSLKYFIYNNNSKFNYKYLENYFKTPYKNQDILKIANGTGYYYIYAIAKDKYGNTKMKNSGAFVMDNSAPIITLRSGPSRILLGKTYYDPGATAIDKYYDGNITNKIKAVSNVDTSKKGIYQVTYTVSDSVGNKTTATRRVEVYPSTPTIYLKGGSSIKILYGTPYQELGATAYDEVEGDLTNKIVITGTVNNMKEGTYQITYEVSNSSGIKVTRTRTVEVYVPDPVIKIKGNNPYKLLIGNSYSDEGATAIDEIDGDLTNRIITTGSVNPSVSGTYYITYKVTNNLGKVAEVIRTVEVYVPNPVITIKGSNPYPIFKGQTYADEGATATDEIDGDLTDKIIATSAVNVWQEGTYPITYSVTNSNGGIGEAVRTVSVRKSTLNIILKGGSTIELLRGTSYEEPGYTAIDEVDGDLTSEVEVTSNIDVNTPGAYQVTYRVTNSGKDETIVTRSVTIRSSKLEISLLGGNSLTILRGTVYEDPGYTAVDEIEGDITDQVLVSTNLNPSVAGSYNLNYSVTNKFGDTKTATRTVTVRKPDLNITLLGGSSIEIIKGSNYIEPGYTAIDEIDGDITSKVKMISTLNPSVLGKYTIDYRVLNSGGDRMTVTRTVSVRNPKVTINLNGNPIVELPIGSVYVDEGATATDEILGDVSNNISVTPNLNPNVLGTYTVEYKVISSGVTTTATRTVKVVPLPGPIITFNPNGDSTYQKSHQTTVTITKGDRDVDNTSYKYLWKKDLTLPVESDFITSLSSGDNIKTPDDETGRYYLFVFAKDTYGNISILGSNGFNIDNTAPIITLNGSQVVESPLDGVYTEKGAIVTEEDSGLDDDGLVVVSNIVPGIIGTYEVTYTATDKAGNTTSVIRTVSIIEATLKDVPNEDYVPLYDASYFIGNNPANWVEFGNASDNVYDYIPILWRVIKMDDGGIKIIYEGVKNGTTTIQNGTIGKFEWDNINNTWNRPSTIRQVLNNFYSNLNDDNKDTLTKKINWCIGKTPYPYNLSDFKDNECLVLGDEISAVGLVSAGDYILTSKDSCSGYNQASCGTNNFLKKNYSYFTIGTDASSNISSFIINSNGGLTRDEVTKSLDIRPVINLRPDVLILSGEGTFDNPYKLNAKIQANDEQAPVINFNPNSAIGKLEDENVEVIVSDDITGVNPDSLKYVWTMSTTEPSVDTITNSFENASKITLPTDNTGNYYLWVIAKDRKGNQIISRGGPYVVDNEPPVITMNGEASIKIPLGSVYVNEGATAVDNLDGNVTSKITVTSNVVPNILGTYKVTYNVSDAAGNEAIPVTRDVIVYEITPPTVTFDTNGSTGYAKTASTTVTVTDNVAVDTSSLKYIWTTSIVQPAENSFINTFTNGVNLEAPSGVSGNYYLWIIAKDVNDNMVITSSNVFHINNIRPVITLRGSSSVRTDLNAVYNDLGATATDDVEGNISNRIVTTSDVNVSVVGTYTVTYDVIDNAGNVATQVKRTVTVAPFVANLGYTGSVQTLTLSATGTYRFEVWGASGGLGYPSTAGGKGGYAKGEIYLTQGTVLNVYVGGWGGFWNKGISAAGGWNGGGGSAAGSNTVNSAGGGGGATDIRIGGTALSNRKIVAGGGAGGSYSTIGAYGGGLTGGAFTGKNASGYYVCGQGGTQSSGGIGGYYNTKVGGNGSLGQGGYGASAAQQLYAGGGGGGGYYGGGGGSYANGGGGGSSYIGGVTSSQTIAGNASMPNPSGGTEVGHYMAGYARITYVRS